MFKHLQDNLHRWADQLVTVSLVLFLLVVNLFVFHYASAADGSPAEYQVNAQINKVVASYQQASDWMYDYSLTVGEMLLAWQDFDLAESYQLVAGK